LFNKDLFSVLYSKRAKESQEQYFRRAKRTQILCALVMIVWIVFFTVIGIVLT